MLLNFEELDAIINIIGTCFPILLAVAGSVFGLRSTREKVDETPSVTIVRLDNPTETQAQWQRRRRYQFAEMVLGIVFFAVIVVAIGQQVGSILDRRGRLGQVLSNVLIAYDISLLVFYATLIPVYLRTLAKLRATTYGTRSHDCAAMELILEAPPAVVAQRCMYALRRLRTSLQDVNLPSGVIRARRHYFFNLYKPYFDLITIEIQPFAENQYRLVFTSDGIAPTYRSDKRRNERHIQHLISYITS